MNHIAYTESNMNQTGFEAFKGVVGNLAKKKIYDANTDESKIAQRVKQFRSLLPEEYKPCTGNQIVEKVRRDEKITAWEQIVLEIENQINIEGEDISSVTPNDVKKGYTLISREEDWYTLDIYGDHSGLVAKLEKHKLMLLGCFSDVRAIVNMTIGLFKEARAKLVGGKEEVIDPFEITSDIFEELQKRLGCAYALFVSYDLAFLIMDYRTPSDRARDQRYLLERSLGSLYRAVIDYVDVAETEEPEKTAKKIYVTKFFYNKDKISEGEEEAADMPYLYPTLQDVLEVVDPTKPQEMPYVRSMSWALELVIRFNKRLEAHIDKI